MNHIERVKTIRVRLGDGSEVIINATDYNEELHEVIEGEVVKPKQPEQEAEAPAESDDGKVEAQDLPDEQNPADADADTAKTGIGATLGAGIRNLGLGG